MTVLDAERPLDVSSSPGSPDSPRPPGRGSIRDDNPGTGDEALHGGSMLRLAGVWLLVALISTVAVTYGLGGYLADRDQRLLIGDIRTEITQAANESTGLGGVTQPVVAPERGAPVAVLEIPNLQLQQVVIEGVQPEQTQQGPGHVPGTAGLGQPGNSGVVGRSAMYGGPFGDLSSLRDGDRIVATTRQGQSVYVVESVQQQSIIDDPTPPARSGPIAADAQVGHIEPADSITTGELYGPSEGDQLTLVTSAALNPFNAQQAWVVVARMDGSPFEPTPQDGLTQSETGTSSNPSSWPPLVLALLAYLATVAAATALHRRARARVVYLVTAPAFIAFTIVVAQTASQLLPAWT